MATPKPLPPPLPPRWAKYAKPTRRIRLTFKPLAVLVTAPKP